MNGPDLLLPAPVQAAPLPEVRNHTPYPSQYFQMMDVGDEVFHVIASRLTYDLRRLDESGQPQLADKQTPLVSADQYEGNPATSACIQESDLAPYKPRCDVILTHATAYAPGGKPQRRWPVGLRVGSSSKAITVTGPRSIERGVLGWRLSEPDKASAVPISWQKAFGGTCRWPLEAVQGQEPDIWTPYPDNPAGSGYIDAAWAQKSRIQQLPAPQIEAFDKPFTERHLHQRRYPAIGLGPVGKWWRPRKDKAGTYDERWKQERWPKLPEDFDFAYWNAAPEDQQIEYPQGGEDVVLAGFLPQGETLHCRLPGNPPFVRVRLEAGPILIKPMKLDTLMFDLKALTLSCVHRMVIAAQAKVRVLEVCREWKAP